MEGMVCGRDQPVNQKKLPLQEPRDPRALTMDLDMDHTAWEDLALGMAMVLEGCMAMVSMEDTSGKGQQTIKRMVKTKTMCKLQLQEPRDLQTLTMALDLVDTAMVDTEDTATTTTTTVMDTGEPNPTTPL